MKVFRVVFTVMVAVLVGGCDAPESASNGSTASNSPQTNTYTVKGVVKKIEAEEQLAIIQHETIPDYMQAMTMPFNVKDRALLEGLQPGDAITFQLHVTDTDSWIDHIKKTADAQPVAPPIRPPVRLVRDVEPLEVGDLMPDYRVTNELAQAVSLSDFKGKALALTFIFTRCPMPDFCPLMSNNFAETHKLLTTDPNAPTNWHLLTISFDPHFDTPAVLKSYAQRFRYDPKRWSFVTGAMIDIDAITEQFNLPVVKQGENWDHKLRTAVIDATGHVQKIFIGNTWKPQELAEEIVKAAQTTPGK